MQRTITAAIDEESRPEGHNQASDGVAPARRRFRRTPDQRDELTTTSTPSWMIKTVSSRSDTTMPRVADHRHGDDERRTELYLRNLVLCQRVQPDETHQVDRRDLGDVGQ